MGTLYLVRHGQASAFAADYDRLSPVGEAQAALLGEYWARRGRTFDAVFTGPRVRHVRTAALAAAAATSVGVRWPEPVVLEDLDEMRPEALIRNLPELLASHPSLRELETPKSLAALMGLWVRGEIEVPELETWAAFRDRVRAGLALARAGEGRGRNVVAFTSGGPIAAALQLALRAPDETALEILRVVRNGSVTELLFSGADRLGMSGFNAVPHLVDREHLTLV